MEQQKKRAEMGLPEKKAKFSLAETMKRLAEEEAKKANEKVIDPYTVKIRKFPNGLTELELKDIMTQFGEVTRVKIPLD
jgi:RNA recognition motif-containing protein